MPAAIDVRLASCTYMALVRCAAWDTVQLRPSTTLGSLPQDVLPVTGAAASTLHVSLAAVYGGSRHEFPAVSAGSEGALPDADLAHRVPAHAAL